MVVRRSNKAPAQLTLAVLDDADPSWSCTGACWEVKTLECGTGSEAILVRDHGHRLASADERRSTISHTGSSARHHSDLPHFAPKEIGTGRQNEKASNNS